MPSAGTILLTLIISHMKPYLLLFFFIVFAECTKDNVQNHYMYVIPPVSFQMSLRAEAWASTTFPNLQAYYSTGTTMVFCYAVSDGFPADTAAYRKQKIDSLSKQGFKSVVYKSDVLYGIKFDFEPVFSGFPFGSVDYYYALDDPFFQAK
jgi:hypothetical protein